MGDDQLLDAAGRIADGEMLDWGSITSTLSSAHEREIAEELALVQQIAAGHRQLHQLLPVATDTPPHLIPDRARWGHLDLLNVVGRGSYGMVYRAWDTRLERLVALKLFHGASNPDSVMQEGRMLARVRHENVVTVYGADVFDGVAGIWMELIHGQTLDTIVKKTGPLPPADAALVGADVSRALGAVHAAGLLHCDVKAQNVVRENGGRVVLMDLGAGRLAPEARDSDQLSDVAGTPRYMAPELFASGADATKASDIYSLGVLIYYLVSGRFPVDGKTLGELKRAHEEGKARSLKSVRSDVPKGLLEIVTRTIDPDPQLRPATTADVQAALTAAAVEPLVETPHSPLGWWILAATIVGALVLLLPLLLSTPTALPPAESIAVMPIKNLTGDPAKQYLADGLTEVLIAHLARVPGLQIASAATSATLRGSSDSERAIAEKLGVRLLLAGSVVQADSRVGLSVHLTDPRAGRTIWGTELEREPSTILSARSEIASLIAARLSTALPAPLAAEERRQLKPSAQEAFLRALVELAPETNARTAVAIDLLTLASAEEPAWAEPLAYLAFAHQRAIDFSNPLQRRERAEAVRAEALRAIQLDPTISMSYTALAAVQAYHDWDLVAAEATLRQAIAGNQRDGMTHERLALVLSAAGRVQEAVEAAEKARDLEPLVAERHGYLGITRYYARDLNGGLADMEHALAIDPKYSPALFGRGRILAALGRYDEAISSVKQAVAISGNSGPLAFLAVTYAQSGRTRDLEATLAKLRALQMNGQFVSVDNYAYIAAHAGRFDEAIRLAQEAIDRRMTNVLWLAVDPRADILRADPRFEQLLSRMRVVSR
jgi:eukaryotic-like serine/threonine-protein kinase